MDDVSIDVLVGGSCYQHIIMLVALWSVDPWFIVKNHIKNLNLQHENTDLFHFMVER